MTKRKADMRPEGGGTFDRLYAPSAVLDVGRVEAPYFRALAAAAAPGTRNLGGGFKLFWVRRTRHSGDTGAVIFIAVRSHVAGVPARVEILEKGVRYARPRYLLLLQSREERKTWAVSSRFLSCDAIRTLAFFALDRRVVSGSGCGQS